MRQRSCAGSQPSTWREAALEICYALNADGLRTRGGREWTPASIHRLLSNVTYGGKRCYRGVVYESDSIPPILDEQTFAAVDARLAVNRRGPRGPRAPAGVKHLFVRPLRLYCGYCSPAAAEDPESAVGLTPHLAGERTDYYICYTNRIRGPGICRLNRVAALHRPGGDWARPSGWA